MEKEKIQHNIFEDCKWNVGDEIEISENQKNLLKETKAVSIMGPLTIPFCSEQELEIKFRAFLKSHPVLCLKFNLKGDTIYQERIGAEAVKLRIHYQKMPLDSDFEALKTASYTFLTQACDFFEGELIRLIAFSDESTAQIYLGLGVHYAVIDMHSNRILLERLYQHFNQGEMAVNKSSNFDFAFWQKTYLKSSAGAESRSFWRSMLKENVLEGVNPVALETVDNQFVSQKVVLQGEKINQIKYLLQTLGLPLSALLLGAHQKLINQFFEAGSCLQGIRVSGREMKIEGLDTDHLLGVINNTLPLPIQSQKDKVIKDFIYEIYIAYCNARMHQKIPYEIIRRDFTDETGLDIDKLMVGVFNFIALDEVQYPIVEYFKELTFEHKLIQSSNLLNLNCYAYSDALELELLCETAFYENNKNKLDLTKLLAYPAFV